MHNPPHRSDQPGAPLQQQQQPHAPLGSFQTGYVGGEGSVYGGQFGSGEAQSTDGQHDFPGYRHFPSAQGGGGSAFRGGSTQRSQPPQQYFNPPTFSESQRVAMTAEPGGRTHSPLSWHGAAKEAVSSAYSPGGGGPDPMMMMRHQSSRSGDAVSVGAAPSSGHHYLYHQQQHLHAQHQQQHSPFNQTATAFSTSSAGGAGGGAGGSSSSWSVIAQPAASSVAGGRATAVSPNGAGMFGVGSNTGGYAAAVGPAVGGSFFPPSGQPSMSDISVTTSFTLETDSRGPRGGSIRRPSSLRQPVTQMPPHGNSGGGSSHSLRRPSSHNTANPSPGAAQPGPYSQFPQQSPSFVQNASVLSFTSDGDDNRLPSRSASFTGVPPQPHSYSQPPPFAHATTSLFVPQPMGLQFHPGNATSSSGTGSLMDPQRSLLHSSHRVAAASSHVDQEMRSTLQNFSQQQRFSASSAAQPAPPQHHHWNRGFYPAPQHGSGGSVVAPSAPLDSGAPRANSSGSLPLPNNAAFESSSSSGRNTLLMMSRRGTSAPPPRTRHDPYTGVVGAYSDDLNLPGVLRVSDTDDTYATSSHVAAAMGGGPIQVDHPPRPQHSPPQYVQRPMVHQAAAAAAAAADDGQAASSSSGALKTEYCRHEARGCCRWGASCRFAHKETPTPAFVTVRVGNTQPPTVQVGSATPPTPTAPSKALTPSPPPVDFAAQSTNSGRGVSPLLAVTSRGGSSSSLTRASSPHRLTPH